MFHTYNADPEELSVSLPCKVISLKFLFSLFSRNYLLNQPPVMFFEPDCDEGDAPLQGSFCCQ